MNLGAKLQVLGHDVDESWRAGVAAGLEQQVRELAATLRHLEVAEQIFEQRRDERALTETRSYAGRVRERMTSIVDEARVLRAAAQPVARPSGFAVTRAGEEVAE